VTEQSSVLVVRISPHLNGVSLEDRLELEPEGSRVWSELIGSLLIWRLHGSSVKLRDFVLGLGEFGRVDPLFVPVTTAHSLPRTGTDSLQHEFSRVGVVRDRRPVSLEVINQDVRVLADTAKVDTFTASLQEQQSVKVFEQDSVGLMDGTQDGLTGGGELSQESNDVEGALTVETGGGFVQEEQKLGLRGQFNTDSKSLSSFNTETVTGETNHGIGKVLKFQQLEDLLHVVVLFSLGYVSGLTEIGRVSHGLSDRSSPFVDILLLDVGGSFLEGDIGSSAVDLDVATDDTGCLSRGENIQKRRLTGTRRTHKSGQGSGLDITKDVLQELTLTSGNRDGVAQVFPCERSLGFDKTGQILLEITGSEGGLSLLQSSVSDLGILVLFCEHDDGLDVGSSSSDVLHKEDLQHGYVADCQPQDREKHKQTLLTEEDEEADKDTKVSPLVAVPVVEGDFKVPHTRDDVLTGCRSLQGTCLRGVSDSVSETGKAGSVRGHCVGGVTSQIDTLELVDHQGFETWHSIVRDEFTD
jgi:hypothetical protein